MSIRVIERKFVTTKKPPEGGLKQHIFYKQQRQKVKTKNA